MFRTINSFYKETFGTKVYKVPVAIADDCPNRRGLKGMKVCSFCDPWGSAADPVSMKQPLKFQIEDIKNRKRKFQNATKFLVYFQAYTTTFMRLKDLRSHFEEALSCDDVVGMVVGTRPDCLSPAVLDLWKEYANKTFLGVELGVQSFDNNQLNFLQRGHTAEVSLKAIEDIAQYPEINLGIHLMFGLPSETKEDVIETAKLCSSLPIQNVKLHNLHVLKNTKLEQLYKEKKFHPLDLETYTERVIAFLKNLDSKIAVHRLAAHSSRWDELVAPNWTQYKMKSYQYIIDKYQEAL